MVSDGELLFIRLLATCTSSSDVTHSNVRCYRMSVSVPSQRHPAPHGVSKPSGTPVLGHPVPSSGLWILCKCVCCTDIHASKASKHMVKQNKYIFQKIPQFHRVRGHHLTPDSGRAQGHWPRKSSIAWLIHCLLNAVPVLSKGFCQPELTAVHLPAWLFRVSLGRAVPLMLKQLTLFLD